MRPPDPLWYVAAAFNVLGLGITGLRTVTAGVLAYHLPNPLTLSSGAYQLYALHQTVSNSFSMLAAIRAEMSDERQAGHPTPLQNLGECCRALGHSCFAEVTSIFAEVVSLPAQSKQFIVQQAGLCLLNTVTGLAAYKVGKDLLHR